MRGSGVISEVTVGDQTYKFTGKDEVVTPPVDTHEAFKVTKIVFDPSGDDAKNPNGEYVQVKNREQCLHVLPRREQHPQQRRRRDPAEARERHRERCLRLRQDREGLQDLLVEQQWCGPGGACTDHLDLRRQAALRWAAASTMRPRGAAARRRSTRSARCSGMVLPADSFG